MGQQPPVARAHSPESERFAYAFAGAHGGPAARAAPRGPGRDARPPGPARRGLLQRLVGPLAQPQLRGRAGRRSRGAPPHCPRGKRRARTSASATPPCALLRPTAAPPPSPAPARWRAQCTSQPRQRGHLRLARRGGLGHGRSAGTEAASAAARGRRRRPTPSAAATFRPPALPRTEGAWATGASGRASAWGPPPPQVGGGHPEGRAGGRVRRRGRAAAPGAWGRSPAGRASRRSAPPVGASPSAAPPTARWRR